MTVLHMKESSPIERNIILGRAIIHQAMDDVISERPTMWMERDHAYDWFFKNNKDFKIICDIADVDPDKIRKRVRFILDNPDKHTKRYTKGISHD